MADDFYKELGVDKDARPEDIKRAFKRKASKHHPDKGGDTKAFQAITLAYDVLSDPRRRAHYDSTGVDQTLLDRKKQIRTDLANAFMAAVESEKNVDHVDLLDKVAGFITNAIRQNYTALGQARAKIKKLENVHKRLSRRGAGGADDPISARLLGEITAAKTSITFGEDTVKVQLEMLEELKQYSYRTDEQPFHYGSKTTITFNP